LHDASGERAAVGAGTGSLETLLTITAPHCSGDALKGAHAELAGTLVPVENGSGNVN
jgi:hypothetical protein